jgi:hypothetical protein
MEPKDGPPEEKVRLNAQEGLAESHEIGNVQKRIWCELMELHTVNKEKPTEKLVGRKRETAEKERKEHYPVTARGLRDSFSAWEFDGILGGDEAVRRGLLHLLLYDGGAHTVGGRSFGHDALRGQMFHTHPVRGAPGGLCASGGDKEGQ